MQNTEIRVLEQRWCSCTRKEVEHTEDTEDEGEASRPSAKELSP